MLDTDGAGAAASKQHFESAVLARRLEALESNLFQLQLAFLSCCWDNGALLPSLCHLWYTGHFWV